MGHAPNNPANNIVHRTTLPSGARLPQGPYGEDLAEDPDKKIRAEVGNFYMYKRATDDASTYKLPFVIVKALQRAEQRDQELPNDTTKYGGAHVQVWQPILPDSWSTCIWTSRTQAGTSKKGKQTQPSDYPFQFDDVFQCAIQMTGQGKDHLSVKSAGTIKWWMDHWKFGPEASQDWEEDENSDDYIAAKELVQNRKKRKRPNRRLGH